MHWDQKDPKRVYDVKSKILLKIIISTEGNKSDQWKLISLDLQNCVKHKKILIVHNTKNGAKIEETLLNGVVGASLDQVSTAMSMPKLEKLHGMEIGYAVSTICFNWRSSKKIPECCMYQPALNEF